MDPGTELKLSQPRFGQPQLEFPKGKLHLQARFNGRDYLSLVSWKKDPFQWSWHFYNRKLDSKFQTLTPERRYEILVKFLKDQPVDEVQELRDRLMKWDSEHFELRPHASASQVQDIETGIEALETQQNVAGAETADESASESENEPALESESEPEAETSAEFETRTRVESVSEKIEIQPHVSEENWGGHNLIAYFEELNTRYFDDRVSVPVRWTKNYSKDYHYGITFGFYNPEVREICINSRLNQAWIPDFFIKLILHHEMLHAVTPSKTINGQTWVHHKEFRQKERLFEDFKKAVLWQRANLKRLMKKPSRA